MSAIMTTFGCQSTLVYIDIDLAPDQKRYLWMVLCVSLCGFCSFLYATGGAAGYFLYGDAADANVLTHLPFNFWSSTAQILISAVQLMKAPLLMYAFMDLTLGQCSRAQWALQSHAIRAAYSGCVLAVVTVVAMSINLRRIMAIIGGFTFTVLWIILP